MNLIDVKIFNNMQTYSILYHYLQISETALIQHSRFSQAILNYATGRQIADNQTPPTRNPVS